MGLAQKEGREVFRGVEVDLGLNRNWIRRIREEKKAPAGVGIDSNLGQEERGLEKTKLIF